MADARFGTWARVMVEYSTGVRPGDVVAITGGVAAEPLLRALYREVVLHGGNPVLVPTLNGLNAGLIASGTNAQLEQISTIERFVREEADVLIVVSAE